MSHEEGRGRIVTNDPISAAIAGMLARIEVDLIWVKKALDKGEENFSELKEIASRLTGAVDRLTRNAEAAEQLEVRVRALENEASENRPATQRWRKINDAFVLWFLKLIASAALAGAAAAGLFRWVAK